MTRSIRTIKATPGDRSSSERNSLLDMQRLRAVFGPDGDWARACGARVRDRRDRALHLTLEQVAVRAGTTLQTIARVEQGEIVPRDYLRAAIAYALCHEVNELWLPLTRAELRPLAVAS